jgi:hypothetical protein
MKTHQYYRFFAGLPRTSKSSALNEQRRFERLRCLFAETLKRLLGTGERLRATLGEPD